MAGICFEIPELGTYFYDGTTNNIYTTDGEPIQDEWYTREMDSIEWHNEFSFLKEKQQRGLSSLMLQLTRACNLRCSYCVYSGTFSGMLPHANENMSSQTIRQSIDFFMEHSTETTEVVILFYGGEPLLQFEHIKLAVEYAQTFNRRVRYGISSNGILLTPNVVAWLAVHPDVYVTVTVNGNKHDVYRKSINGKGTLNEICKNFEYIKQNYPAVWERQIRQIANLESLQDVKPLREFYSNVLHKIPVMVTRIDFSGVNEGVREEDVTDAEKTAKELEEEYIRRNDPFLNCIYEESIDTIHNRPLYKEDSPGFLECCMPAAWRLFVRTDGSFNMCEKVSDSLDLGNVYDGYNMDVIQKLYSGAREFAQRNCRGCWAQRLCKICYQDIVGPDGNIIDHMKPEWCEYSRKSILRHLIMYVTIASKHPERLDI